MADRPETKREAPHAQADNIVRVWFEQSTVGDSKAITPNVVSSGSGSILSRNGTDCVIETDSHVVTPRATADVMMNQKSMDRMHITADGPLVVSLDLDTTTKIRPFVQLPNGKIVEAKISSNEPKLDHAILKFKVSGADYACIAPPGASSKHLKVGETFTELGFGHESSFSAHSLVLTGEKTVGAARKALARQKIGVDEVMAKWNKRMPVLIFDGAANPGDSGGPVFDKDGLKVGRTLASGAVTIDGKTKYITYAAPTLSDFKLLGDKQ